MPSALGRANRLVCGRCLSSASRRGFGSHRVICGRTGKIWLRKCPARSRLSNRVISRRSAVRVSILTFKRASHSFILYFTFELNDMSLKCPQLFGVDPPPPTSNDRLYSVRGRDIFARKSPASGSEVCSLEVNNSEGLSRTHLVVLEIH